MDGGSVTEVTKPAQRSRSSPDLGFEGLHAAGLSGDFDDPAALMHQRVEQLFEGGGEEGTGQVRGDDVPAQRDVVDAVCPAAVPVC